MSYTVDTFDRAILQSLQTDCSKSLDALADQVNLSRNALWRRIKLLEEHGIITARVAKIDPAKIGLGLQVIILLRAADHTPDWLDAFNRAVRAMPEIISAQRMSGDLDYVLTVHVADMAGYDQFYKKLIEKVALRDISASFVMENIKDGTALPV